MEIAKYILGTLLVIGVGVGGYFVSKKTNLGGPTKSELVITRSSASTPNK